MTLCEENCDLIEYDYEKEKVKCSCDIKLSVTPNYDIKFNKNDFFKSFTDINNILNLSVMKCYKIVLKIKNLKNNYGFFIIGFIVVFYFVTLLLFLTISFDKLKKEIAKIIFALKLNIIPIKQNVIQEPIIIINKAEEKAEKLEKENKNNFIKNKNRINNIIDLNYINEIKKEKILSKNSLDDEVNSGLSVKPMKNEIICYNNNKYNDILEKKDFEMNSLNYDEALKLDHRNYFQYYISLLKFNHPLMLSFAPFNDYNSKIIKIFLFFFSFCLDFTINVLFFTDDTIHKIYQDKGAFNFLYKYHK